MEFRKGINRKYTELFAGSDDGNEYSAKANFGRKWGWYSSIYGLAKGDVTAFNKVTRENIHQCLTYLTFEKEKTELERKLMKQKMR